jgi:hypothetical protein
MKEKPYVIVRNKKSGRAFSMNRSYMVLEEDLGIIDIPDKYVEDWDGWLTVQASAWVHAMGELDEINNQFHAYWMY